MLERETLVSRVPEWFQHESAHNPNTHVSAPYEVACYSRSADRVIHHASRNGLRTFHPPQLPADLNKGYETFIRKDESEGSPIDPVVVALKQVHFDLNGETDVVTFRNNLNKIAATPYQLRDDWEIDAVQIGTTVFLDIRKKKDERSFPNQDLFMYYGYSFEALCTNSSGPVNSNEEFCSVVRIRIGNHRILMSAEVDAMMPNGTKNISPSKGRVYGTTVIQQYVEFKTMKEPRSPRDFENLHKFKFLKFWIQSYLAGVPRIILGVRDQYGTLLRIDELSTRQLPKFTREALALPEDDRMSKRSTLPFQQPQQRQRMNDQRAGIWVPFVCINHIDFVLGQVRETCAANIGLAFTFRYDSQTRSITCSLGDEKAKQFAMRIANVINEPT
eukprot:Plantae.Rhodophyta-Hildenbrandia_rubra.ctg1300.p1 GENE.Plantae.Rhodophyta-Hildenbrandia_rubra.ctg1300~~Plantae.Rhodophyta-Hildenbrandia_rubra.ctg1300.p1  ORF type:complete len:388 (-),score=43.21 Plantae.Rhodophyta-Hildenbrandia_rubra.ctg1300:741-1904(-)